MAKKKRIDSISENVRVVQKSREVIEPPPHMYTNEKSKIYFDEIIEEKAKADWTPHQVSVALMLSRMMAELDYNQEKMMKEGSLVKSKSGDPVLNPRRKLITEYFDKINSTRRGLGIYALAGTEKEDVIKRYKSAKEIEKNSMIDLEDLIARPSIQ